MTLEDIGETNALLCETNQTTCCGSPNRIGKWIFPNGAEVSSSGGQWDFYRTRGEMVVQLHRKRGGEDGIYRCEIPDSTNILQTIYIGVYTANTGK